MKKTLKYLLILLLIASKSMAQKINFVGISLGSTSFRDGISSPIRYDMPIVGLWFEHQKMTQKRLNYSSFNVNYGAKSDPNKFFQQSFQTNFSLGRLFSVAKNVYLGGEASVNINTRLGRFVISESNPIGGNLTLNISPALFWKKDFETQKYKYRLSDTFSAAVLGLGVSGGGNYQGGTGAITTFSALNKFYNFRNSVGIDWQNQNKKSGWRLAYHWEFTTFKSPINSQYGSSSISISKML